MTKKLLPKTIGECFNTGYNFRQLYARPPGNVAPLDGVRAISILYVTLIHVYMGMYFWLGMPSLEIGSIVDAGMNDAFVSYLGKVPYWLRWIWHGEFAVEIFFVLSGFLIGGMLIRDNEKNSKIRLWVFYRNRFLRLMPILYICLAIFYLAGDKGSHLVWANILYVNNFIPFHEAFMDWTWTLAVEEQFYMALPVFMTLFFFNSKHKLKVLFILWGLSFVIRFAIIISDPVYYSQPMSTQIFGNLPNFNEAFKSQVYDNLYTRFGALVPGVIAAWICYGYQEKVLHFFENRKLLSNGILVVAFGYILLQFTIPLQDPSFHPGPMWQIIFNTCARNFFAVCITYIMVSSLYGRWFCGIVRWVFSWWIWYPMSQLAYSFYLLHIGFIALLMWPVLILVSLFVPPSMEPYTLSVFVTTFFVVIFGGAFCSVLYTFIERPFMNMRDLPIFRHAPKAVTPHALGGAVEEEAPVDKDEEEIVIHK